MMLVYWYETLVILFFTALRMAFASQVCSALKGYSISSHPLAKIAVKLLLIPAFVLYVCIFMFLHLCFILTLIAPVEIGGLEGFTTYIGSDSFNIKEVGIVLLGFFVYHLVYFLLSYVRPRAYKNTSPIVEMTYLQDRIALVQGVLLIVGLLLSYGLGGDSKIVIALVIVGFKIFFSLPPEKA